MDVLIIEYDASGNEIGYSTFDGSAGLDDKANCIAVNSSGVSFTCGPTLSTSTGLDYVTIKCLPVHDGGDNNFSFHNPNGSENPSSEIPDSYSLYQNYPNPFNPVTRINYSIPHNGSITLKVYDILGREIAELVNEYKKAGNYNVSFDGSKLASGLYIYKLVTSDFTDVKKMIFVK